VAPAKALPATPAKVWAGAEDSPQPAAPPCYTPRLASPLSVAAVVEIPPEFLQKQGILRDLPHPV